MNLLLLSLAATTGLVDALHPRARASLASVDLQTWDAFNQSVGGRLRDGKPMLAPCYTTYNGQEQVPDEQECSLLRQNGKNSTFISGHFGGYQNVEWGSCLSNGESCTFELTDADSLANRACDQGSVPFKYVDAQNVGDVQETLSFAMANNLHLVIKNTGHDFTGRSAGPDSLGLWTHSFQPPIELEQGFMPDGCSEAAGDVITFGAGQQFSGIYKFAHEHGYRVVGGSSDSVGAAGGWITGGGHGLLSNELGLGVDNVQQLRAVLPNGTYVTANRCQNQDIFFALRGGGGGTFGVVTEMSTLVHPDKPMALVLQTQQNSCILVENTDKWVSEGWAGYVQLGAGENVASSYIMATSMIDQTAAETSMKPVLDFAQRLEIPAAVSTTSYFDLITQVSFAVDSAAVGGYGLAMASRIIPRESFQGATNQQKLSSILNDVLLAAQADLEDPNSISQFAPIFICSVAPTLYSQNLPESDRPGGPGASAVTPAWRTGIWHFMRVHRFKPTTTDPDTVRDIFQDTHDVMNPLREFTPNAGAYQNEGDTFEADPIGSFWGEENYARLLKIKKEVDPTNLLSVHNGVGWDSEDERFRCYPEVETSA